jgi:GLPGLI family protein
MQRIFWYLLLFFPCILWAQSKSGEVVYVKNVDLSSRIETADSQLSAELAALLPSSLESYQQLLFNAEASLYRDHPEKNKPQQYSKEGNGISVRAKVSSSQNARYRNLTTGQVLARRDFMGRTFLIEQAQEEELIWKITGEQKIIADYLCLRAVYAQGDSSQEAVAWFTPQVPVGVGPGKYGQLPGLILRLELEQGTLTFTAESVDLRPVGPEEMAIPDEGKRVTREKYDRIVEQKTKEVKMTNGGATQFQIIRRN